MPVIRRTAQAEEDLIDIWLYIAQDNPGAADRLLDEIEEKFFLLIFPFCTFSQDLCSFPPSPYCNLFTFNHL